MANDYRHYQIDDTDHPTLKSHTFGSYHQPDINARPTGGAYAIVNHDASTHAPGFGEMANGQGTMFKTTRKGGHTVDSLMSTKEDTHLIPGLIGRAAMHSERTYGRRPAASSNLSQHSAKLVQNLVDRGILRNPTTLDGEHDDYVHASNDYDWYESGGAVRILAHSVAKPKNAVPASEHLKGSQFVRDELRATRPGQPPPDPNQTELVPADPYRGKKKYMHVEGWRERPEGH